MIRLGSTTAQIDLDVDVASRRMMNLNEKGTGVTVRRLATQQFLATVSGPLSELERWGNTYILLRSSSDAAGTQARRTVATMKSRLSVFGVFVVVAFGSFSIIVKDPVFRIVVVAFAIYHVFASAMKQGEVRAVILRRLRAVGPDPG